MKSVKKNKKKEVEECNQEELVCREIRRDWEESSSSADAFPCLLLK